MRQTLFISLFLGLLFFGSDVVIAQTGYQCGTSVSHGYAEAQDRSMPGYFGCEQINKVNRKFSILFQVVKDSLGGTTVTDANLNAAIDRLNSVWEPTGISFEFCERRNLDNHQFNNYMELDDDPDMMAMYYEPNIINVFITSTINLIEFGDVGGYAVFPGGRDIVHVTKASMSGPGFGVLIHEMGHFFGLFHTFETDLGVELVDGSNCATTGDLICDTEANPADQGSDFDADCNYTANPATDAMGNFYVPPATNFMSYSPCGCQFTKQQYNRMVEQYLQFRNYLW